MEIRTLSNSCPWANLFPPGTVLWRRAEIMPSQASITVPEFEFVETPRGTYFAKLTLLPNGMWEPELVPHELDGNKTPGIAVFCAQKPSKYFTHLLVQRTSRSLSLPGKQRSGAIFACEAEPYPWTAYAAWRRQIFESYRSESVCDIERAIEISRNVRLSELRENEKRLILQTAWTNLDHFNFVHI